MITKKRYTFHEIKSEVLKEKIYRLLVDKYTIRLESDPVFSSDEHIKKKKRQSMKAWRRLCWISMMNIDKERAKLGLSPLYNCK